MAGVVLRYGGRTRYYRCRRDLLHTGWNKRNADAIVALNFFLGWTFIGWVIALVWALIKDPERE